MKTNFTRFLGMLLIVVMCMSFLVACGENESEKKYQQAYELLESKDYKAAYDLFVELGDYKDAAKEAARFHYAPTSTIYRTPSDGGEEVETYTTTYNEKNLPSQTVEAYSDGTIHTCNYIFNELGQFVECNCTETTGSVIHVEYIYNEKGELIKCIYDEDGKVDTVEYVYDEKGNNIYEKNTFSTGRIFEVEYTFDENNNIIKDKSNNIMDGEVIEESMYEYTYDEKGNEVKRIQTVNGELYKEIEYTYDENSNCIKEVRKIGDTQIIYNYTYNENNKCIKELAYENDILMSEYNMTYDENGNLIKMFRGNEDEYEYICEYTYEFVYVPYDIKNDQWETIVYYYLGL